MAVFVAAVCIGCGGDNSNNIGPPSAKQFFSEPPQLRLAEAVARGDAAGISEALRRGADVDAPGRKGIRMLMWAMLAGNVDGFNTLLDRDANLMAHHFNPDIMRPGYKTYTVAEHVCVFADKRFLESMLARGFDPNRIVDHDTGETMLFYAVFRHDREAVRRLLDAGADVNHVNHSRESPLQLAEMIRDYRIAMYLYSRGADPLIKTDSGFDVIKALKVYGSRGVTPQQKPYFEEFVAVLESRGLITQNDIVEADKPKGPDAPGITVIEHSPDSEAGQAILELDRAEREANRRDRR